jgi:predicted RNase H-like HicB family nuclease
MKAAKKAAVKGSVPVIFLREGGSFVAFCPVLDLSTCGSTFAEADANFQEALAIFFEECVERGTLEEVLASCGWERPGKRSGREMIPPAIVGNRQVLIPEFA